MNRKKIAVCIGGFVALEAIATFGYLHWKHAASLSPFKLPLSASDVWLDDRFSRGDSTASYRLVEFGDFECGPCRRASDDIKNWQDKAPGDVRFQFRHLPLENHLNAYRYAVALESEVGDKYWSKYDALFELQDADPAKPEAKKKVNNTAGKRIEADMTFASRESWSSTPTLVLITPAGGVYLAPSVKQARKWVSERI